MLAGSVVHRIIEDTLKNERRGKQLSLEQIQKRALKELNLAWLQSRKKRWRNDPKRNANLFEHYYQREVTEETIEEIRACTLDSLANFSNSATFAQMRQVPPARWRALEDLLSFHLDGIPINLRMDLALEIDGTLAIYDWKTGGEDDASVEQLVSYAMYAEQEWGYSLENISLNLFYLSANNLWQFTISAEERAKAREKILHNCHEMRALLVDSDNNVARKEDFPMTDDRGTCDWCFYQELCYG